MYQRDKKTILSYTDKALVIEKAELESFATQLQQADAIYVTGGTTRVLKERLLTCPDFVEFIKGKTYAGSSAGANVVSAYYISGFSEGIQEGMGILPIRTMTHYGNAEFNATKKNISWFDEYPQDLELVLLPECEWLTKEYDL